MSPTRFISRIPVVSRMVVMLAASLLAVAAATGLPDDSAPAFSTVAMVSGTSPGAPVSTGKCKKRCKKGIKHSRHVDVGDLSNDDVESVAALSTVLAVVALAAVI